MNRRHTLEQYKDTISKIQENGKFVSTVLMSAFPTETYEDLNCTIDFIRNNNILVGLICRYSDFACIPSHDLEQLSNSESIKHTRYLKERISISNKEIMTNMIPQLGNSIVIGHSKDGKRTFFENVVSGYSYKKEFLDCKPGDIITSKPKMLVKKKKNDYAYEYRY